MIIFTGHAERNLLSRGREAGAPATCSRRPRTRPSCGPSSASPSGGEFVDPALATVARRVRPRGAADQPRARDPAAARRRHVQRRGREEALHLPGDGQEPRPPHPREARGGHPHAGRRHRPARGDHRRSWRARRVLAPPRRLACLAPPPRLARPRRPRRVDHRPRPRADRQRRARAFERELADELLQQASRARPPGGDARRARRRAPTATACWCGPRRRAPPGRRRRDAVLLEAMADGCLRPVLPRPAATRTPAPPRRARRRGPPPSSAAPSAARIAHATPLHTQGELIGVLVVVRRTRRRPPAPFSPPSWPSCG